MGGWGTWKLAIEHPELFAAVAPVCAPVDILMLIEVPKLNMPIRIYHGALDDVVLAEDSILMHQELKKQNKQSELFIFPTPNFINGY
jgi:predicted peptidase